MKKPKNPKLLDPQLDTRLRIFNDDAREAFNELPFELKEKSLNAKTFIIYPFEVHYNQRLSFEEKERNSINLIKGHLLEFENVFVATSRGMDSTVLEHLVLRAYYELLKEGHKIKKPEFWLNNTLNIYKEEREYWNLINRLFGINDQFKEFKPPFDENGNRFTVWSIAEKYGHLPHFRYMHGKKQRKSQTETSDANAGLTPECCDILKKDSIKEFLKNSFKAHLKDPSIIKYDCHFIGTRAEESRIRKIGVMQRCRSYTIKNLWPYEIRACTPLSYWTTKIWKFHQGIYKKVKIKKQYVKYLNLTKKAVKEVLDSYDGDTSSLIEIKFVSPRTKVKDSSKVKILETKIMEIEKEIFIPNKNETEPENDIEEYYKKYMIPKNPTYKTHNMSRMGCASCPAHKNWEIRLAKDPTNEGFGMLKQNLLFLKKTQIKRFDESIKTLKKYLDNKKSYKEIQEYNRKILNDLIIEITK